MSVLCSELVSAENKWMKITCCSFILIFSLFLNVSREYGNFEIWIQMLKMFISLYCSCCCVNVVFCFTCQMEPSNFKFASKAKQRKICNYVCRNWKSFQCRRSLCLFVYFEWFLKSNFCSSNLSLKPTVNSSKSSSMFSNTKHCLHR